MNRFCVMLLVTFPFIAGYVQAVAFSKVNLEAEVNKATQTEYDDQITEIHNQMTKLQQAVAENTRSFSALELIVKELSMIKNIVESSNTRVKRDVGTQSPQTPTPTSSPHEGKQSNSDANSVAVGTFSWLMHPGPCLTCPAGVPGPMGPPGPRGIMGRDGRDGRDALIQPEVQEPTSQPDIRTVGNSSQSGVIYIRWGSNGCPERAELIYKGTVGGSPYTHTGGGANYLCMPEEPIYDEIEIGQGSNRANLYSSEYEFYSSFQRLRPMHDHTPTCAVCKAPSGRATKLMIPARNVCPSTEWRLEYAGYLMTAKTSQKRTEHICVDRAMDVEPRTSGNQDGARIYMVEAICQIGGGLPCGPYVDGYELTCAVCTI